MLKLEVSYIEPMKSSKEENKFTTIDLLKSLWFLVDDKKKTYTILISLLFVTQLYSVVPAFILGNVVDFFTEYNQGDSLALFYGYIIFLGVSMAIVSFSRLTIKNRLGKLENETIYNIRTKGFEKLITLSLLEHKDESTGAKAQKVQSGVLVFKQLMLMFQNRILLVIASTFGIFSIFLFSRPIYALFIIAYIAGYLLIVRYFHHKIQQVNLERNIVIEQSSGSYVEGLSNVMAIKATGAEKHFQKHINKKEDIKKSYDDKALKLGINLWKVYQIFNSIALAFFLFIIGWDVTKELITVGSIVMYFTYIRSMTENASNMLEMYNHFIEAKTTLSRMMPIFWNKEKEKNGSKAFPSDWREINIDNISFDYKKDTTHKGKHGIKQLNLSIKKYQKIGLVGETGSGKSTLAKLLLGLYKVNSGKYLIGNTNFYNIKNTEILNNIAIVLQEPEMFNLSLKENITLMRDFNLDLFKKAIQIVQLENVIKKLPEGMDTLIGEKGYHLSGGERQRVGIARAIYRDTPILILDEATSSVDTKTESLIQEAIENKLQKKTLIFIAHRVSTLKNVDQIHVFSDGIIVESGKYNTLLKNNKSVFNKLYNK